MRIPALAALVFVIATAAVAQTAVPDSTPWDYEGKRGTLAWGKLDPAFKACSQGHEQSPIDIRGARLDKNLQPIEFHYMSGPVKLVNTGHTVRADVGPGSYIVANGVRYDLVEFHFHHPGEEAVKGKITDMDIHLVHKSAEGKIAVIAVRLIQERGEPNAVLATLWPHLPAKPGASEEVKEFVSPAGFLPSDQGYWTYVGSLTAPPCTEGVTWIVLKTPVEISSEQIQAFAKLYPQDVRPAQPLNGRSVKESK